MSGVGASPVNCTVDYRRPSSWRTCCLSWRWPFTPTDAAISGRAMLGLSSCAILGGSAVLLGQQPDAAVSGCAMMGLSGCAKQSHSDSAVLPGQQPNAAISGRAELGLSGCAKQSHSESALCFRASSRMQPSRAAQSWACVKQSNSERALSSAVRGSAQTRSSRPTATPSSRAARCWASRAARQS